MRTTIAIALNTNAEKHVLRRVDGLGQELPFYRQAHAFAGGTEMPYEKLVNIRQHYETLLRATTEASDPAYWERMFVKRPGHPLPQNTGLVHNVPLFVEQMASLRKAQVSDVQAALDMVERALEACDDLNRAADEVTYRFTDALDIDSDFGGSGETL